MDSSKKTDRQLRAERKTRLQNEALIEAQIQAQVVADRAQAEHARYRELANHVCTTYNATEMHVAAAGDCMYLAFEEPLAVMSDLNGTER